MRTSSPAPTRRRLSRAGVTALLTAPVVGLAVLAPTALGADVTEVPFTSSGTWTVPAGVSTIDVLVVGGGGGGTNRAGGGGGQVTVCAGLAVTQGHVLTATVGSGGTSADSFIAGSGGTSSVSLGGGAACSASGGAGGKGGQLDAAPNYYDGGASGNGNAGGAGGSLQGGGGGGGAGAAGGDLAFVGVNSAPFAGAGGAGVTPASRPAPGLFSDVTATFYGGGGGGGTYPLTPGAGNPGAGGTGGGGAGADRVPAAPTAGAANTGGGGGGSSVRGGQDVPAGAGGSGYVAIRHVAVPPPPTPTPNATPAGTSPSVPATPKPLAGTTRAATTTGRVTTTGTLPDGATAVAQTARAGGSASARGFLATARAKSAQARCTIDQRTYRCSIVLTRGVWTLSTVASGPSGVVATSTRRVVVRGISRAVPVVG